MQDGEYGRHEEQRRHRRDQQAADDGAAERGILLAAFAQRKRHRQHADDHGERRHQHRAKPGEAGLERRRGRVEPLRQALAREADEQNAVRRGDAHAHDRAGQRRDRQRRAGHEQHPDDAGERRRQRRDDDERIEPRLEVDHDQQIDEHDRAGEAEIELTVSARHRLHLPARSRHGSRAARPCAVSLQDACRCRRDTAPRSRPCTAP